MTDIKDWPDKTSVEKTIKKYTKYLFDMGEVTPDRVEAMMWALHDVLAMKAGASYFNRDTYDAKAHEGRYP